MSFDQFRTNPSQAVSKFKGRTSTPKAWPSTAVGDWTNGGLFGGGYVLEDSYEFFAKGSYSGRMNIQNIPQTHRHLHIDFTSSNQSTFWAGVGTGVVLFNQPSSVQPSQPNDGNWDGMKGYYYYKGWSGGSGANTTGARSSWLALIQSYSNNASGFSLQIYNYSDSTAVCKPARMWCQFNPGSNWSGASFLESYGFLQAATYTQNGSPSPAITSVQTYDSYANGSSSYQSFNVYGFGGKV